MGHLTRILLAGTALAALTGPAQADPLSIGISILVNLGYSGAISGFGATLLGSALLGSLGLGASLISNALFQPKTAAVSPSDRQATVRQSVGARVRFYGTVKVSGTLWFFEVADGTLYVGITLNEGEIDGIREVWLNNQAVTTDADGTVTDAPYRFTKDGNLYEVARVLFKYGTADQTVFSILESVFDEIGPDHRLRGIAVALAQFQDVPQDEVANVYPQLNPQLRVVMDASKVYKVREGTFGWSDNPGDVIYDYLTGVDGAGLPYGAGYTADDVDIVSFREFASLSYQLVPIKAGGSIARYRIWGGYGLNEEQRDVLPRMLNSCDGELYVNTDGKIAIRGGQWAEPTLVLDSAAGHIISGEFRRGQQALAAFNELTVTYVEPELDFQEVEAETWVDTANVALSGRPATAKLDLPMVPHHAQARRLAKIHTAKRNPEWFGTIITNFYGFNAINEQMVRVKFAPFGVDTTFRILNLRVLDDFTGVELSLASLTASAYEWDAELEEGDGPNQPANTSTPIDLPPPDGFAILIKERVVSGEVLGYYIEATWIEPDRTSLEQQVQYRQAPSGDWFDMTVADGIGLAESGIVSAGVTYDVRIRTRSPAGGAGPWSDPPLSITASFLWTADNNGVTADNVVHTADEA